MTAADDTCLEHVTSTDSPIKCVFCGMLLAWEVPDTRPGRKPMVMGCHIGAVQWLCRQRDRSGA